MSKDFREETWNTDEKSTTIESYIRAAGPAEEEEEQNDDAHPVPVSVEKKQEESSKAEGVAAAEEAAAAMADDIHITKKQAPASTNDTQSQSQSKSSNIMNIFKPSHNINYDFISAVYGGFTILGLALYLLETMVFQKYTDDRNGAGDGEGDKSAPTSSETMKELAESTQGLYLIFAPFSLCLVWSLVVRKEWRRINEKKKQE